MSTKTGREVSSLWLIPVVPVFLVGLFFVGVTGLTSMAVVTTVLDLFPGGYSDPAPVWIDHVFVVDVLRFDHWIVGLVGLSCPWLAAVPGFGVQAVWDWATTSR